MEDLTHEQFEIIDRAYKKLKQAVTEDPLIEIRANETFSYFHEKINNWDGKSDIEFINNFLFSEGVKAIAADPKIGLAAFKNMGNDFIGFVNNGSTKDTIKKLFKIRKDNLEILQSDKLIKYSQLYLNKIEPLNFIGMLDNQGFEAKPIQLSCRFMILIFPEIMTTIADYSDRLKRTCKVLLNESVPTGISFEMLQWRIRFKIDQYLISQNIFYKESLWTKSTIAWFILED